MNKKAQQALVGFAFVMVAFVLFLTAFGLIDVFKEVLDDARGDSNLNCPGTPDFNQTSYDADGDFNQTVRRPTCFVTGISMVWLLGSFLIATISWVALNFRKSRR